MYLEQIQRENDIKKLSHEELPMLAEEIRAFLVDKISKTGGHLASNLGVVELTIALHRQFLLPDDKIIWDVGHQAYTHKILTGRRKGFDDLRKYNGMSGFPKRKESNCDAFDTGHSSTSISVGLGYAKARDIQKEKYRVISVIGDGALTGGMAYEALNNAAQLRTNFIVILNDNNMSISKNVGGMSTYLNGLRTAEAYADLKLNVEKALRHLPLDGEKMIHSIRKTKSSIKQFFVPGMFFEDMGITYLGPIDGHDLIALEKILDEAKRVRGPVIVHVLTKKGKGYTLAEESPSKFHGPGPFDVKTGEALAKSSGDTYTEVFGKVLTDMGYKEPKLVAVTAAMAHGTGLTEFSRHFPDRFFDVGIAEEHAVTFCAGLSAGGLKPVFAVYSSFLQRGYDQLIHDVGLQNLPVVFAIDRAGLVGSDGETHQGIFDVSFLSGIPNMVIMAPKNRWELADMLRFAISYNGPIALRYPRGEAYTGFADYRKPICLGESEIIYDEEDIAIIAVGNMVEMAVKVRQELKEVGYNSTIVNARFIKPIDSKMIEKLATEYKLLVTMEENVFSGGYGEQVCSLVSEALCSTRVLKIALPDDYIEHGSIETLRHEVLLDTKSIVKRILAAYIGL